MITLDKFIFVITICAALGSGLIAGVFFAFSTSVMKALGRLPAHEGIAAMQSINIVILNPLFLGVFMGTALACVVLAFSALFGWQRPGAIWLLIGSILYLVGSLLVTAVLNVPMNDTLASAVPDNTNSAALWADYLNRWTMWNHVRTVASIASTVSFIFALVYSSKD
jgi:uncharacterized membrane protein